MTVAPTMPVAADSISQIHLNLQLRSAGVTNVPLWEMIMTVEVDDEGLDFFNALSGWLDIALSEPAQPISKGMQNLAASPSARVERVSLTMRVLEDKGLRNLTDEEWTRVVLRTPVIRMCGNDGKCVVEHGAPNGAAFTVRDLAAAIAETETQTRGETKWFGGIDVHHIYFEALTLDKDGVWFIEWGS